jgi:hypothetical protein
VKNKTAFEEQSHHHRRKNLLFTSRAGVKNSASSSVESQAVDLNAQAKQVPSRHNAKATKRNLPHVNAKDPHSLEPMLHMASA